MLDHVKIAYEVLFGEDDEQNIQQTAATRPKVLTISWDEMVQAVQRIEALAHADLVKEMTDAGVTLDAGRDLSQFAAPRSALDADRELRRAPSGGGRRVGGPGGELVTRTVPFEGVAALTTREAAARTADAPRAQPQDLPVSGYARLPSDRVPPNPTEDPDRQ